jgi:hypothetical protein
MSFIGKILVVAQMALSVLFLFVGGAVYVAHTNWKELYDGKVKELATANQNAQGVRDNAEREKATLTADLNAEKDLRLKAEVDLQAAQINLASLTKDKNDLQAQIQRQTGIAETKSNEAGYRDEEARKQRIINADIQARLDTTVKSNRALEDELFTTKSELADLSTRYDQLLETNSDLEKVAANAGLNTNPRMLAQLQAPPPPVDGLVKEVRKDRTNRPKFLLVSIGSDDGLLKGHELDAYRSGVDGRRPQWLGKIRVVSVSPDEAVCEVLDPSKTGIIEVGDNVTSKLH